MLVAVAAKTLNLIFESAKFHHIKSTGDDSGAWVTMYYITSFAKGVLFFSAIALIGTGWSYLKPFLTDRDKSTIGVVLVLQVFINIALAIVDEESPGTQSWLTWKDVLHLFDIICCIAILFPILWSIRHFNDASRSDDKAAETLARLRRFRSFYVLTIGYIYISRIVMLVLTANLSYDHDWIGVAGEELTSFAFYIMVGYLFQPMYSYIPLPTFGQDDFDSELPDEDLKELERQAQRI